MLELSTPVVKLWDGILALPMIGTLDSDRTQVVMETLLQRIVETGSELAIIDITGVPTVDTLVAQHLLKTVTAARLMGAECIISGIRPQIAQTIVHLGVDLGDVITKATLADAFARRRCERDRARGRRVHGRAPEEPRWNASRSSDGRVPARHHPGGHARPARDDAAGRPDRAGSQRPARSGVLIDISSLDIVDSFIGRMIGNIAADVARARRRDGRRRHAAGRRDHPGRARACRSPGSAPRSTSSGGWHSCAPRVGGAPVEDADGRRDEG